MPTSKGEEKALTTDKERGKANESKKKQNDIFIRVT